MTAPFFPRRQNIDRADAVARLRRLIARKEIGGAATTSRCPTGHHVLDEALGGGLLRGAVNEVLVTEAGGGAAELLLPALGRLPGRGLMAWVHPNHGPYPPAVVRLGIDLDRLLLIRPRDGKDQLWAIEQALRSPGCDAVAAPLDHVPDTALRRLQLAAREGETTALLFRMLRTAGNSMRSPPTSPAPLRLAIAPRPAFSTTGRRVAVRILRAPHRGRAYPEEILVEWNRDPLAHIASPPPAH